jgi:hypothetical protein
MTAPDVDPLVCINARMVGEKSECGFPESSHCPGCRMCPGLGNCTCTDTLLLPEALDAFARHAGATSWSAFNDVVSHNTADTYRAAIAAAIAPLQDEIRRLTTAKEN